MRKHDDVLWHHVPSSENPADLGSRGGRVDGATLWRYGPEWLADKSKWPPRIVMEDSEISHAKKESPSRVVSNWCWNESCPGNRSQQVRLMQGPANLRLGVAVCLQLPESTEKNALKC